MRKFDLVRIRVDMIGKSFEKSKEFVDFMNVVKKVAGGNITVEKSGENVIIWQDERPAKNNGNGKGE